jgi:hypothetical protein
MAACQAYLVESDPGLRTEFKSSQRVLDARVHPGIPPGPSYFSSDREIMVLNNLFVSLTTMDSLNLRRYASFGSLVGSVMVVLSDTEQCGGCVNFPSSSMDHNSRRSFKANEDGSTLTWYHDNSVRQQEGTFGKVSYRPLTLIMGYAVACSTVVVFDLDKQIAYGLNVSAFAIDRRSRIEARDRLRRDTEVVIQMSTQESCTDFSSMQALLRWRSNDEELGFYYPGYWSRATIRLRFELDDNTMSLQNLKVDVLDFIRMTYDSSSDSQIQFLLESKDQTETNPTSFSLKLGLLRLNCYLLLSWVIINHPHKTNLRCPQIWINGEGQALKAVYPSNGSVPSETLSDAYVTWSQRLPLSRKVDMISGYD